MTANNVSYDEYYVLPITFNTLAVAFTGTGATKDVYVIYVDQTGLIEGSEAEEDDAHGNETYTTGTVFVLHLRIVNGVIQNEFIFMCIDFWVAGDRLNELTIDDIIAMILTLWSANPHMHAERCPDREIRDNHWIFDSFNIGVTDDPDYGYNRFFERNGAIFIFADENMNDNLINY